MPKPGSRAWKRRVAMLLRREQMRPERWHYVSYADDGGFRGGIFIQAHGITDASLKIHRLGLYPGGESMTIEIPDDAPMPEEKYRNRILDKAMLQRAVGEIVRMDGTTA